MVEIVVGAFVQIALISIPFLVIGLVVSALIGFFQAVTQIQDPTLAFIPKLLILAAVVLFGTPWFLQMMTEYSQELYQNITITGSVRN